MESDREINIEHLTEYQVEMLDIMWGIDDEGEFMEWYRNLDSEDQVTADNLMRLMIMELREEDLGDMTEAQAVLKQFML